MYTDPDIVQAALQLIEQKTQRRRPLPALRQPHRRNALHRGTAWSVCTPCELAIARDAAQIAIEPPLIRRCLMCRALLGHRRRNVKTLHRCVPQCALAASSNATAGLTDREDQHFPIPSLPLAHSRPPASSQYSPRCASSRSDPRSARQWDSVSTYRRRVRAAAADAP